MLVEILKSAWMLYLDVAIYMLFGFFVAGLLRAFFKADKIRHYLGKGKIKPVFLSALFGIPIPLCSCGVVPVATGLKKQGANSGAALSFMIATPESGVDSIAVSYAMLDPVMTVARPVAAFITAVSTGIVQNFFGRDTQNHEPFPMAPRSTCDCTDHDGSHDNDTAASGPSIFSRLVQGIHYAFTDLVADIAKPFFIGILIAGAITFFVPDDLTVWANGHPLLSMLVMLAAGIPMYVCATSSTPIAAALILKGLNPGAALVFLLAGPATNAATMNIIRSIFNTRTLVIYLSMIAICSLTMGLGLDWIYTAAQIDPKAVVGSAGELIPLWLQTAAALVLALLFIISRFSGHTHCTGCSSGHDHAHSH